jgi:hypothetical protein
MSDKVAHPVTSELMLSVCSAFPQFELKEVIAQSVKSVVLRGKNIQHEVVVKVLRSSETLLQQAFQRELKLLTAFCKFAPTFLTPQVLAIDPMVPAAMLAYVPGTALGLGRFIAPDSDASVHLRAMLTTLDQVREFPGVPTDSRESLAKRYLHWWQVYIDAGFLHSQDNEALISLLARPEWRPEFQHADCVLKNWIASSNGLYLLDWELASGYLLGYDQALLWCLGCLNHEWQQQIESAWLGRFPAHSWQSQTFWLNVLIISARELRIQGEGLSKDHMRQTCTALSEAILRAREKLAKFCQ